MLKVVSFAKKFLQQWRVANHSLPKITANSSRPENDTLKPPTIAETLGVREALSWIKAKFPEVQTIEMDALLVYNALQNDEEDNSYFGILIDECHLFVRELSNLKFSWVQRSAKQLAHTLAKAASSLHVNVEWSYFPPLFISNVLFADLMNE
ncbi:unnamed protein product [Fraxinus pennsylvanica]|uniref:RNase H type-1 domain-containing protein n=1 Tax=Fraxinus pennsylvanica TaxID=56036 RepID=A0AAD2DYV5_9LAMI|nr:unnamed protein product [Fraxinus pennsylvanica]